MEINDFKNGNVQIFVCTTWFHQDFGYAALYDMSRYFRIRPFCIKNRLYFFVHSPNLNVVILMYICKDTDNSDGWMYTYNKAQSGIVRYYNGLDWLDVCILSYLRFTFPTFFYHFRTAHNIHTFVLYTHTPYATQVSRRNDQINETKPSIHQKSSQKPQEQCIRYTLCVLKESCMFWTWWLTLLWRKGRKISALYRIA